MSFTKKISEYKDTVTIFLAVAGVAFTIFNFILLNSLSPVLAHLESLDQKIAVEANNRKTADEVTNNTVNEGFKSINTRFDDLLIRINAISTRITSIDNALLKR